MIAFNRLPGFDKVLTILTSYYDATTKVTSWHKWVVDNCFYSVTNARSWANADLYKENQYTAKVPQQSNYKPYDEWCNLGAVKSEYLSIEPHKTVILKGLVEDTIADDSSPAALLKLHDGFIVNIFKDCTDLGLLNHYRMSGA